MLFNVGKDDTADEHQEEKIFVTGNHAKQNRNLRIIWLIS